MRRQLRGIRRVAVLVSLLTLAILALLAVSAAWTASGAVAPTSSAAAAAAPSTSAQLSPEVESLVGELQTFIPQQLEFADVPGLAIAVIQGGEIVWEDGFGEANTVSGDAVNKDSVFEVASLSKTVVAYSALALVDSGALKLDEPLYRYFDKPWLARSEWSDQVTLRHLLTHTSGLSKRLHPLDKSISFPPGERFAYSNVGFQYLQAVLEQVSGSDLETVARANVIEPLAMESTTFADRPDIDARLVNGHINYGADLAPLLAVLAGCFAVVLVLGILVQRLARGRIAMSCKLLAVSYAIAALVTLPIVTWLNGGFNKWSLFFTLVIGILSVWLVAWFVGGALLVRRLPARWRSGKRLWVTAAGLFLCCMLTFVLLANVLSGPIPKGPSSAPGAAYSLKSTAGDLARFIIELAEPRHLSSATAAEMVAPQVRTSDSNSWGLGIAVYHGPDGDWLWHTGDDLDFHALMAMRPDTGDGVVVLTNGQAGQLVNYDVAKRAMGVEFSWSSR